ncbi:MAG: hypothetical protein PHE24_00560 [Patescibacteria group bacterium]|nr:hypothetical protein [Patescibacteria group bacterium]
MTVKIINESSERTMPGQGLKNEKNIISTIELEAISSSMTNSNNANIKIAPPITASCHELTYIISLGRIAQAASSINVIITTTGAELTGIRIIEFEKRSKT